MHERESRPARSRSPAGLLLLIGIWCAAALSCGEEQTGGTKEKKQAEEWSMVCKSIGVIRSPYTPEKGAPHQGGLAPETESTIVLEPEYEEGLTEIENFSHIIVLYAFDRMSGWSTMVKPPWDDKQRGVFASRSPRRPNPIGMTVAKLVEREGAVLRVQGLDAFDGTPVLDLKPYVPRFDRVDAATGGRSGGEK
jgi:tRNA-Thr(GGU) m(6)t(6)A37 methyltransferase TsaA